MKNIKLYRYSIIVLLFVSIIISSCSTKKNTVFTRAYHNLTTHYNIYWNGEESFKEGKKTLNSSILENYNLILPVYNFGSADNARKIYSQMDRAIEKGQKAIPKHSLFFDGKEYNKWIDDSYLLIARSQFYKQDYDNALRTLEYIITQFPEANSQFEAQLWKAKIFTQQKKLDETLSQLEFIDTEVLKDKHPFKLQKQVPLVFADHYVRTNNFELAKVYLKEGISLNRDSKLKARLNFISGQIAQSEKNYPEATKYYSKVIKSSAPYEMIFNARINMAQSFDKATGNIADLEKQLKKMLRDVKNKDYQDQIYFALAELAKQNNNDSLVIDYLKKSVATSVKNNYQKSSSALELADIFFKKQNYSDASLYYDTTIQFLPREHPNYDDISSKTLTLADLVTNLQVVQHEDSLQRLAKMPIKERDAIIAKIIEKYKEEERLRKEEEERLQLEQEMMRSIPNMANRANINVTGQGGTWYFYNPSTISFGFSEFTRKWGRRKLEDNWRLSNKNVMASFDTEIADEGNLNDSTQTAEGGKKENVPTDPLKPETYIAQLPTTPEKVEISNQKIAKAIINLGYIYKDGLADIDESVKSFEDYIDRFPNAENILTIYYQLYLIGVDNQNDELIRKYRSLILRNFPDSDYAEIIQNPEYNKELLAKKNRANSLYEEAFKAYESKQYRLVDLYTKQGINDYDDEDLLPRFMYLNAIAQGELKSQDSLIFGLKELVRLYPTHPVSQLAKEIIELKEGPSIPVDTTLYVKPGATPGSQASIAPFGSSDTTIPSVYKVNLEQTHFYIIVASEYFVNIGALKNRISDFISKSFSKDGLSVNSIVLDGGYHLVTVTSFKNSKHALDFYKAIRQDDYVMGMLNQSDFRHMVISMENYPIFYREKQYDGYMNFFKKHYDIN